MIPALATTGRRAFPFLAALVVVALAFFAAFRPAAAQTAVKLRGNIDEPAGSAGDHTFLGWVGQPFTTGGNSAGHSGYKLTRVDLTLRRPTSTPADANPTYAIYIRPDGETSCGAGTPSNPDTCPTRAIVGTLTNPAVAALPGQLGTVRITVPGAGIDLAANTRYWLVIESTTSSAWWRIGTIATATQASDASVPAGWNIYKNSFSSPPAFLGQWATADHTRPDPFKMDLYGYEKTIPPPTPPVVTTASETSLTVSWSAPSGGAAVTDYDLRYYAGTADPADPADWIEEGEPNGPPDPGTATTATITGLSPGTAYRVQVRAASGGREGPWSASFATATVFPLPPPPPPDPAVSVEGGRAAEGSPVTFTAWVSPPADADVVLGWSTGVDDDPGPRGRNATPGADYRPVTDGSVTIPAGERKASFSVETLADAEEEDDETFVVTIIGTVLPDDVTIEVRTAVGTIEDDYTPPAFESSAYAFDLPENTDGSGEPFGLGAVSATDPGGGELSYALASGDMDRFAVGAGDGAITYTGTGEDFETEPNVYELTVRATDAGGLSAEALVTVAVVDVNEMPSFGSPEYAFELRENVDGSEAPVALGSLSAADPEGDALSYALVSGDAERFAVGAGDGAVAYTGPGEDYESEPNLYELTVRVTDPDGLSAEALVTVEILDVNEMPEAADDAASTVEDVAVTVDVLANDTDPDGDGLRVASVSAPANGTAAISAGGVMYTPAANWHGTDRFMYTADDGKGGTSEASVEVTVTPVNDAPEAVGPIPAQSLDEGAEPARIELGPFFDDLDGDALGYRASSSDPSVVEAAVSGSVLTLVPVGYGSATVEVTAADAGGLTAMQTVSVGVTDHAAREAVSHTLAGLARSHLASARTTLGRRAAASRSEASRLTLLGRDVPLDKAAARTAAEQMWSGWLSSVSSRANPGGTRGLGAGTGTGLGMRGAGVTAPGAPMDATGGPGAAGRSGSGNDMGLGDLAASFGDLVRFHGGRDPLHGSEFQFAFGGAQEAGGGGGLRFQLWGQGDVQTFQGAPSDASDYEGELQTGYVGVDTWLSDHWMLGVAVARSRGTGDWRTGGTGGSLETRLVAVHPYLQWSSGATSVWAMGGAGWGDADNVRDRGGRTETSGLGLRMGLVELRRRLAASGGFEFGLRTDAAWAELATDDGTETLDGQTAAVNQVRFGAELSQELTLGGLTLAPFGEAHVRRDGGDGQPGTGLELIGGLRAQAGFLRIDAQGRVLAVHSAAGYEERGFSATLSLGSQGGTGPSLSLSPRWGDAASGGNALWQEQVYSRYVPAAADGEPGRNERDPWALDLSGGYGMRLPGDRLLTWSTSVNHSPAGPRFMLGAQLGFGGASGSEPTANAMVP